MNITVTISELVGAANSIKQANGAFRAAGLKKRLNCFFFSIS